MTDVYRERRRVDSSFCIWGGVNSPPLLLIMDQLIEVKLLNPHDHNFKYKRPDGSMYKVLIRHNKEPVTEEVIDYDGPLYSKHPDL